MDAITKGGVGLQRRKLNCSRKGSVEESIVSSMTRVLVHTFPLTVLVSSSQRDISMALLADLYAMDCDCRVVHEAPVLRNNHSSWTPETSSDSRHW